MSTLNPCLPVSADIQVSFVDYLRGRGYSDATIRLHEQRLVFIQQRVARTGRILTDLNQNELWDLLKRMRPQDKVLCRDFIRVWIRYRRPLRLETVMPWQAWVDEYLDFRSTHQGICEITLAKVRRAVGRYLRWQFGQHSANWSAIRVQDIWRYSDESSRDYKRTVANQRLGYLRGFLRFVCLRGACPIALANSVPTLSSHRFEEQSPAALTEEQRLRLLESFDRNTAEGVRDYALALCMTDLGLRVGEVVLLRLSDVDWTASSLAVPGIKMHPGRTLPLVARLREALRTYIDQFRPVTNSDHLFVRHPRFRGAPLDTNAARHAMRCAYRRSGFPSEWTGAHRLRHTFASRLYSSGAPVKEISDMLGHRSINSTKRYAQIDMEGLRQLAQPWPL